MLSPLHNSAASRLLTYIPPSPQVTRPEAIKALEHHHFDAVEAVLALA